uniref:Uncharacterized protein n=1 Tax=Anguilla anguilla TaxID=7936 RepID=A0A0E9U6N8_ANGAN
MGADMTVCRERVCNTLQNKCTCPPSQQSYK